MRKLALAVLCLNVALLLLGMLLAWRSQRAAKWPTVPTNLARVVSGDASSVDSPAGCSAHSALPR